MAVILAVAYFAVLAGILFWPSPVDKPAADALAQMLTWLHSRGVPQRFINYNTVEFAANILLFIPFGIVLALRLHRSLWWLTVPIAAAASGLVELAQGALLPQRVADLSDVIVNTSGALIGAVLVLFVWSARRRRALRTDRHTT